MKKGLDLALLILAFFAAIIFLGWAQRLQADRAAAKRKPTPEARASALFDQTREFLAGIEQAGVLPSLETPPSLHLQPGEFVVLRETGAVLCGFKSQNVAVGVAAGATIAGIRMYPGVWQSESAENMTALAIGDCHLTNTRLLFVSPRRTVSIPWRNLVSVRAALDSIQIATDLSEFPYSITLGNALLWSAMIIWMSAAEVTTPALAACTRLVLSRDGDGIDLVAHLTVNTESEPDANTN